MRSIFIHLTNVDKREVAEALGAFHCHGLYFSFYEDHLTEYEPEDVDALKERLGAFPPDVTLMADISGKIVGYEESLRLAQFVFSKFTGLIQDDGDGLWSFEELLQDRPSAGVYFMEDSRRHAGLKVPSGNSLQP